MADTLKIAEKENVQNIVTLPFLLRVGGLPLDVVDGLRFAETANWAEGVLSLENMLAGRKEQVADALYAAVHTYKEERAVRRKLINLRRDVFNMRALENSAELKAFAETLASPERELLLDWVDLWEKHSHLLRAGQELFTQELSQKRAHLKHIVEIMDFRKGLALASPILDNAIDAYLAADNLHLNRSSRTVERSLVEYLLRTACKTSPFSTFTAVCPGTFDNQATEGDPDILYQIEGMEKKSFTRLNVAVLARLSAFIVASPQIRSELLVSMTPGWHILNGRIRYLRKMQRMENTIDEADASSIEIIHENVFYLAVGPLLQTLIDLLRDGRKVRFHELVSQLSNLSDSQHSENQNQINAYLERLLQLGLLIVPDLQFNLHSKYPLERYRQGLLALRIPVLEKIAAHLALLEVLVKTYAVAPPVQRREILEEIRQKVLVCYAELGQTNVPLPKTLLYEDTTLTPQKLAINTTNWQNILSSVAEFQQILPLFDRSLPRRLVTEGYFQARYGAGQRCDDFLSFAYEFRQRFFEHYLKSSFIPLNQAAGKKKSPRYINYFHQSNIALLERAQQALTGYIDQAYKDLPAGSCELTLGDDFVETFIPYVPKSASRLSSHTFFSQFARINGEATLVVNQIYTGLTLMFSRFGHFFDDEEGHQLVHELRNSLQRIQPIDAVFAELKGGYDTTNLNIHPQVTPYELVCPGDLSSRARDEQIPLEDLAIQDDQEEGCLRLYSKRLGKEVIPVYLGFLLPMALPEIQQVLLNFAIAPVCQTDLWKDVPVATDSKGIQVYPQLKYKNIVLQRARWKFPQDVFPQRASGQSDADFFLTVARWRKEHHIPSRLFVAPAKDVDTTTARSAPENKELEPEPKLRAYKPLYVDFENSFSLALLEAAVRSMTNGIMLTEMLPHRDHLWFQHNDQSYVSEFVWEMNSVRGGHHG
jgi:Lantibiotic dehydratase, N terminus